MSNWKRLGTSHLSRDNRGHQRFRPEHEREASPAPYNHDSRERSRERSDRASRERSILPRTSEPRSLQPHHPASHDHPPGGAQPQHIFLLNLVVRSLVPTCSLCVHTSLAWLIVRTFVSSDHLLDSVLPGPLGDSRCFLTPPIYLSAVSTFTVGFCTRAFTRPYMFVIFLHLLWTLVHSLRSCLFVLFLASTEPTTAATMHVVPPTVRSPHKHVLCPFTHETRGVVVQCCNSIIARSPLS
jgi:hypothetical protein